MGRRILSSFATLSTAWRENFFPSSRKANHRLTIALEGDLSATNGQYLSTTSTQAQTRPEAKNGSIFSSVANLQQAADAFNRHGSSTAAKRRPKD